MHLMVQNKAVNHVFSVLLTYGFLSVALEVSFIFIDWSFPIQLGVHFLHNYVVEDSWEDYIYSLPTLYGVLLPIRN